MVVLAVAAALTPLSAAPAANRLGLGFGASYLELRDDVVVPLSFIGPVLSPLRLTFDRFAAGSWFGADCRIALAPLFDPHGFLAVVFPLEAGAQYYGCVGRDRSGGRMMLGGELRWSEDVNMPEYWDDEHFYWLTALGLAPAVAYTRPVRTNERIDAALGVTVAALVSRPPLRRYNKTEPSDFGYLLSRGHEGMRFATVDKYQAVRWQVAWTRPLARTDFTVAYRGRFARADWPLPVMVLEHSVAVSWGIRL